MGATQPTAPPRPLLTEDEFDALGRIRHQPHLAHFPQTDQSWRNDAACVGLDHLFFIDVGASSKPARAICASCPVSQPCLDYAIATNSGFGIWGGLVYKERVKESRRRRQREAS